MKTYDIKECKKIFLITFICCIITHFMLYSNVIKNADCWQYTNIYQASTWEISAGRWLIPIIDMVKGQLNLPILTSFLAFICVAASVVIISVTLKMNDIESLLTGITLSVSPFLAITLTYSYCCDSYALALLLSSLAAYLTQKKFSFKWMEYLAPAVMLALSLALYQTYLSVTLLLFAILLIREFQESRFADWLKRVFKHVTVVGIGMILYLAIFKVLLFVYQIDANQTYGVYTYSFIERIKLIPSRIVYAYQSFGDYFFKNTIVNNSYYRSELFSIFFVLVLLTFVASCLHKTNKLKYLTAILLLGGIPFWTCITCIISPDNPISLRNSAPLILFCPCVLVFFQEGGEGQRKRVGILRNLTYGVLACILWTYFLSSNAQYEYNREVYNQERTYAAKILYDIEKFDEYTRGMPVCIIGTINTLEYGEPSQIGKRAFWRDHNMYIGEHAYSATANDWKSFMSTELGATVNIVDWIKFGELYSSFAFSEMSVYPREGSIAIINGTLVVKLSEKQ